VYPKAKDEVMNVDFGARGKRRLNRVFDAIGFIYVDYCFPTRKRGLKRKSAMKASSVELKQKKMNVLTHRPKSFYLETAAKNCLLWRPQRQKLSKKLKRHL
jgi:hypothetical protein